MTRCIWAATVLLVAPIALLQSGCNFDGHCINCAVAGDTGADASVDPDADGQAAIDSGPRPDACIISGVEVCDDLDNDCDGTVDEDIAEVGNPCGVDTGECVAGTLDCIDGDMLCADGFVAAVPEVCDSRDNDCDGADDNGDPGGGVICGTDTGECRSGLTSCIGGVIECTGMTVDPVVEICDGKDNDCDGAFDEGTPAVPGACGTTDVGLCDLGLQECIGGVIQCVGNIEPVLDVCDTFDNDCDGMSDEDFLFASDPANCGSCGFVCSATDAFSICSGGMCEILACDPGFFDINGDYSDGCEYACNFQGAEVCGDPDGDGNPDEDCDNIIDEGIVAPSICDQDGACAGTIPTCMTSGWVCVYGAPVETDGTGAITPETLCDGEDNDCDGLVDEPFPTLGTACDDGALGICKGTGAIECISTTTVGCVIDTMGMPMGTETCNGLDDDCDGTADNGDLNDWVPFSTGGSTRFMWRYEASRPDADAASGGVIDARACSKPNAIPWTNITHPAAEQLCSDLGLRLCTETEWQDACEAGSSCTWSYNSSCDSYSANKCNGNDYDCVSGGADNDCLLPTGERAMCYAGWGGANRINDMSGNVKEWTAERSANINPLRGGSYNNTATGISCGFDFTVADDTFQFPNVGFRCCSDTLP